MNWCDKGSARNGQAFSIFYFIYMAAEFTPAAISMIDGLVIYKSLVKIKQCDEALTQGYSETLWVRKGVFLMNAPPLFRVSEHVWKGGKIFIVKTFDNKFIVNEPGILEPCSMKKKRYGPVSF